MSKPNTNTVITIGRQFGSAGLAIGRQVAKDLGIKLYDKEILDELASEHTVSDRNSEKKPNEKSTSSFLYSLVMDTTTGTYADLPINHQRFIAQTNAIKKLASEGPCVLVGRCADYALEGNSNVMSFFIHADLDSRIRRIARIYDVTNSKAQDMIKETDIRRHNYYNFYSNKKWGEADSYHMCLDSSVLGIEGTAEVIEHLVSIKENNVLKKL